MPPGVVFEEYVGVKGYSGGQEKDWIVHLKEEMSAFGNKFEGWRKGSQKVDRWFGQVEEGPDSLTCKWHAAGSCRAAGRHAMAGALSTVGISKRLGAGGTGGELGKREGGGGRKWGRPAQEIAVWVWPSSSWKIVGLPMADTSWRKAALTFWFCCVFPQCH